MRPHKVMRAEKRVLGVESARQLPPARSHSPKQHCIAHRSPAHLQPLASQHRYASPIPARSSSSSSSSIYSSQDMPGLVCIFAFKEERYIQVLVTVQPANFKHTQRREFSKSISLPFMYYVYIQCYFEITTNTDTNNLLC